MQECERQGKKMVNGVWKIEQNNLILQIIMHASSILQANKENYEVNINTNVTSLEDLCNGWHIQKTVVAQANTRI